MSLARYFKLFSYLMVLSGFTAISAGGGVGPLGWMLFGGAMIASWFADTARVRRALPSWVLGGIYLACIPLFIADYAWLSRSLLISVIHLLLLLAAILLLTRSSDQNLFWLYLISFAWLAAAGFLSVDPAFVLSLLLFIFAAVGALMLFEMRRSHERALRQSSAEAPATPAHSVPTRDAFARFPAAKMTWLCLAMTGSILVLSIPLFLVLPRVSAGFHGRPHGRMRLVTGFSERVVLGEIGMIKESDAVVMKVRMREQQIRLPPALKWRGIALDHFDGRTWTRSVAAREPVRSTAGFFKLEDSARGTALLLQTFYLDPLSTDVIFAANRVLAVSSDLGHLERDTWGALYTTPHPGTRVRYVAVSDVTAVDSALVPREQGAFPGDIAACLQLPGLDPRIAGLAGRVTAAEPHPMLKARMLERHLRSGYRYSLRLKGPPRAPDPLSSFLFEVREGHCEYFASAMAIMLRQIGIPARLVNGFRAGDYSTLGDLWVVRQYDAHSWVEAYFKPFGWVEFDPTPAEPRRSRSGLATLFAEAFEALDVWWWEGVISYDFGKQLNMLSAALSWANSQLGRADMWVSTIRKHAGAAARHAASSPKWIGLASGLVALAAAAAVALLLWPRWASRLVRKLERKLQPGSRRAAVLTFYEEALEALEARGFARGRSQTALEFAHSLRGLPAFTTFMELTRIYYRARFGGSFTTGERPRAAALLTSLRATLRQAAKVSRRSTISDQ